MNKFISLSYEQDDSISLCIFIKDEIMQLGEKLNEICDEAYMNGYNWEALINCYIEQNAPELLDEMDCDSEAGMFCAYFENEDAAESTAQLISDLIDNPEKLFDFVRQNSSEIEWD